jgi:non-specific protein-tyrosine kinase
LALVLEYLGDAVRTRRDVVAVAGIPPIARVRHALIKRWRRSPRSGALIMLDPTPSSAAEAFRSLRASLRLAAPPQPLSTLVITSAGPREGKTFVACNLAIALAQSGKRVLLVDADLRRPTVHAWFGVANQHGFTDALTQDSAEIQGVIASGIENLWLLPAGSLPANPGELLGSEGTAHLMTRLGHRWDMVILDCAPVGPVADTLLLAHQASGSVVVARCGQTRRVALHGALAALNSAGQPVIGVVLNDERPGPLAQFSRYDYYHHGYWSDASRVASDERAYALHNGVSG